MFSTSWLCEARVLIRPTGDAWRLSPVTSSNDDRRRADLAQLNGVDIERQLMVLNPCGLPHDAVSASPVCRGRLLFAAELLAQLDLGLL